MRHTRLAGKNKLTMCKRIEIHGQIFEMNSRDGKLWCSSIANVLLDKKQKAAKDKACKMGLKHLRFIPELSYPDSTGLYSLSDIPS